MTALTIISDSICPWRPRLIGKARLDAALAEAQGNPFAIRWRPFQLNPDMPAAGADRRAYLAAAFGGAAGAARIYGAIADAAAREGPTLDFKRIARSPDALDAHRALRRTGDGARRRALAQALFDRYFQRSEDFGDHAVAAEAAALVGMDGKRSNARLATDDGRAMTLAGDAQARAIGASGAPAFVIADRHLVDGAQPADFARRASDAFGRILELGEG